jgi:hypothetical protein
MVGSTGFEGGYILYKEGLPTVAYDTRAVEGLSPDSGHGSTGEWKVEFWDNKDLSGTPKWTRIDPPGELRFAAGAGAPPNTRGIPEDNFSARWETTSNFEGGFYDFISQADDGVRVYIDGVKVVDKWKAEEPWSREDGYVLIPQGNHNVVVEYFENGYIAGQTLHWEPSGLQPGWTGEFRPVGYDGTSVHSTYVNTYEHNGGIPALGYPINNVHRWGSGYIQDFREGTEGSGGIMKSDANDNSYWVGGDFWSTFLNTGGIGGIFGYPTSDGYSTNGGERQNFIGGAILKSEHGTFPVYGGIGGKYLDLGGENSFLGFPTSGESGLGDGWIQQNFESGYILYKEGLPTVAYDTKAVEGLPPDSGQGSTYNWHAQYWNNKNLGGAPTWSQYEEAGELRFAAGQGAPVGTRGIQEDNFSARWVTTSYFDGGIYNFISKADDGVRVYIDGQKVIDKWQASEPWAERTASAAVSPGYHQVMLEYFEEVALLVRPCGGNKRIHHLSGRRVLPG